MLSEYVFERVTGRPITISDGSAVVTGMILGLNMPPEIPVWIPVLGGVFAIVIVKQLYGGLGQNFMNPALAARCFLLISFANQMSSFTLDGVSTATPLSFLKKGESVDCLLYTSRLIAEGTFPIPRWGTPEDVAGAVSALCSDQFLYTTGNYIDIDGGFHIKRL